MNPQVTTYIEKMNEPWQKEISAQIRQTIHKAIPNITESIKYNQAFYALGDRQVCVYFPAKNWVNVTLFHAENLEAPEGFFAPSDKPERKALKIRPDETLDYNILSECLKQLTNA